MAEPTAEKIQNLSLQGTDKEENSDYMNGINSPNEMENFDTNFEHSQLIKPTTNGDHTMAEESYPNDLPQTTDQLVPSSQDCDDTSQMSSQIQDSQEQSQILSGQDGVLVNVDGKENPQASNLPPGMHRYNPFLDPKEMESDSNNPFLSESATGQGDVDSSLSYDGGDQDGSSSAMDVSPVPESQTPDLLMGGVDSFQMEQSPINHGASVMEFDSSPSQNDPSLSQQSDKLSEVQRGNQDEENVQGDQSLSKKENIDNDEKAQLVIIKDIAQDDGLCDTESVTKDEEKSSQERKFSFDEQIVPGCCSCVEEPEPKPSQTPVIEEDSELDRGSGIKALEPESAEGNTNQENVRKTPEIRLQSEDDGFIDKEGNYDDDDIDEEDDEDYYDEGEESDEATPSDNFVVRQGTRAEEIPQHEVDAESDDYPDDDDEIYTDEEDIYDEEDGYRGSEEREGSSDYRESEEREMSQGDRGSLEKEGCEEYRDSMEKEYSPEYRGSLEREMSPGDRGNVENEVSQEYRDSIEKDVNQDYRDSVEKEISPDPRDSIEKEETLAPGYSIEKGVTPSPRDSIEKELSPGPKDSMGKGVSLGFRDSDRKEESPGLRDSIEKEVSPTPSDDIDREVSPDPRYGISKEIFPGDNSFVVKESSPELDQREPGQADEDMKVEIECDSKMSTIDDRNISGEDTEMKEESMELNLEKDHMPRGNKVEQTNPFSSDVDVQNSSLHSYGEVDQITMKGPSENIDICQEVSSSSVKDTESNIDTVEMSDKVLTDKNIVQQSVEKYDDNEMNVSDNYVDKMEQNYDLIKEKMDEECLTVEEEQKRSYDNKEMDSATMQSVSDKDECSGKPQVQMGLNDFDSKEAIMGAENISLSAEQVAVDIREEPHEKIDSAKALDKNQSFSDMDNAKSGDIHGDDKNVSESVEYDKKDEMEVAPAADEVDNQRIESFEEISNQFSEIHDRQKPVVLTNEGQMVLQFDGAESRKEVDSNVIDDQEVCGVYGKDDEDDIKPSKGILQKGDTFGIESEGSDMEERSITPDPDQHFKMNSHGPLPSDDQTISEVEHPEQKSESFMRDVDVLEDHMNEDGRLLSSNVDQDVMSSSVIDESSNTDQAVMSMSLVEDASENMDQDVMSRSVLKDESINVDKDVMLGSMIDIEPANMQEDVMSQSMIDESANVKQDLMTQSMIDESAKVGQDVMSQSVIDTSTNVDQDVMSQSVIDESANVDQDVMSQSMIDESANVDQNVMSQSMIDESANEDQDVMSSSVIDESADMVQDVMSQSMIDESANVDQNVMSQSMIDESTNVDQDVMSSSVFDESANVDQDLMSQSMIDESANVDQDVMSQSVIDESANVNQDIMSQSMIDESANVDRDVMSQSMIDESPNADLMSKSLEETSNDIMSVSMLDNGSGNNGQDLMSMSIIEQPVDIDQDIMSKSGVEDVTSSMPLDMMSQSMVMEDSMTEETGDKIDHEAENDEQPFESKMSTSLMEGSMILDEGQCLDDIHPEEQNFEPSDQSPELHEAPKLLGSTMESSIILDEGQTFEDQIPDTNQMSRSIMEGSIVLDEGETFEDHKFDDNSASTVEDSNTPEGDSVSPVLNLPGISAMEGSIVLEKDEKLEDRFSENNMSKSMMGESIILGQGETFEDNIAFGSMEMSASYSESHPSLLSTELTASYTESCTESQTEESVQDLLKPASDASSQKLTSEEESYYQYEAAQNMVENVLNDAIDKVESMSKKSKTEEEEEEKEEMVKEVEKEEKTDEDKKQEIISKEESMKDTKKEKNIQNTIVSSKDSKVHKTGVKDVTKGQEKAKEKERVKEKEKAKEKPKEKEKPKLRAPSASRDNRYSHITSRLTQETSASLSKKSTKKVADSKIPSPTKAETQKRSQSSSRRTRTPSRPAEARLSRPQEKKELSSESPSPKPSSALSASGGRTSASGMRRDKTPVQPRRETTSATRKSRPTQLMRPKKDVTPDTTAEEEKNPKRSASASSGKRYGIDAKNESYKPGGGKVKIFDQKVKVKASPRIDAGSKTPPSTNGSPRKESPRPKPTTPKGPSPNVKNVSSRIGSLDNAKYTPGGGKVKITTKKTDYSTVNSRVGSTANKDHKPGGGDKKSKNSKIESHKLEFKGKAQSKVGSTDNMSHKPGGGSRKIETQKLDFKEKAKPKIEAKTDHKPGGGDKKIETQKLNFKDTAKPRTDTGTSSKVRKESETSQDSAK